MVLFLGLAFLIIIILTVGFGIVYLSTTLILKFFSFLIKSIFDQPISVTSAPITVKRSLREAKRYAQLIRKTAQQHPAGPMQDRLAQIIKPVDEWLANLDRLETSLKKLYGQRNLTREIRQFSFEIEKLHRQLLNANEENLASLRSLLESKRKHQRALQQLESFQNQAELRIQKIASDLGAT
ncbi:MAG: hypothetical protein KDI79_08890, partial [Anaerolineae bacterium]|nr:hypothetical protein [Anaerolineae bacterium]